MKHIQIASSKSKQSRNIFHKYGSTWLNLDMNNRKKLLDKKTSPSHSTNPSPVAWKCPVKVEMGGVNHSHLKVSSFFMDLPRCGSSHLVFPGQSSLPAYPSPDRLSNPLTCPYFCPCLCPRRLCLCPCPCLYRHLQPELPPVWKPNMTMATCWDILVHCAAQILGHTTTQIIDTTKWTTMQ